MACTTNRSILILRCRLSLFWTMQTRWCFPRRVEKGSARENGRYLESNYWHRFRVPHLQISQCQLYRMISPCACWCARPCWLGWIGWKYSRFQAIWWRAVSLACFQRLITARLLMSKESQSVQGDRGRNALEGICWCILQKNTSRRTASVKTLYWYTERAESQSDMHRGRNTCQVWWTRCKRQADRRVTAVCLAARFLARAGMGWLRTGCFFWSGGIVRRTTATIGWKRQLE